MAENSGRRRRHYPWRRGRTAPTAAGRHWPFGGLGPGAACSETLQDRQDQTNFRDCRQHPWLSAAKPEAELIKDLLVEWDVPAAAIELASGSRNTYENAAEIQDIWQRNGFKSALLVTSAAHMPRAMATFRRLGLPVIASTADVRVVEGEDLFALLPDSGALIATTNAIKEWIGLFVYRLRGWA